MSFTYVMLSAAGWVWLVIVAVFLWMRLRGERRRAQEFGVVHASDHEKQSRSIDSSRA